MYGDFDEPAVTAEYRMAVTASAVSHLAKNRAAGTRCSSSGRFPFVVGIEPMGTGNVFSGAW